MFACSYCEVRSIERACASAAMHAFSSCISWLSCIQCSEFQSVGAFPASIANISGVGVHKELEMLLMVLVTSETCSLEGDQQSIADS